MTTAPTTQTYYDRFAAGYEAERHHGYHRLIDELELDLVRRFGAGKDVFEAGCGTGLLLREAAAVARSAVGLALSLINITNPTRRSYNAYAVVGM
jgi:SAM-dependent methyltransferase